VLGPVVGGVLLLVLLIMWGTSVDLALRPAGVMDAKVRSASVDEQVVDLGETRKLFVKKTAAVSGRVILVSDYPMAPWLTAVVLGLGKGASDDATFGGWSAELNENGYSVKAQRHATLFLVFDGDKPALKAGDYLSVVGQAGIAEQDATIVKGTNERDCWTIKVQQHDVR
jgi:hypothetical protein